MTYTLRRYTQLFSKVKLGSSDEKYISYLLYYNYYYQLCCKNLKIANYNPGCYIYKYIQRERGNLQSCQFWDIGKSSWFNFLQFWGIVKISIFQRNTKNYIYIQSYTIANASNRLVTLLAIYSSINIEQLRVTRQRQVFRIKNNDYPSSFKKN